jgi:hypothetical protein
MTRNLNDAMARIRDLRGEEGSWSAGGGAGPAAGSTTGQWPGANPFYRDPTGGDPARRDPASGPGGAPGDASGRARDWFGNPIEHGRDDPVPCPFCGAGFDRLAAYEEHLQSAHNFRSAAPVRKEYTPNALLRAIGSLRFIPAWFVGLVAFAMWKVLGFSYFVGAISFLLLVMWTQTAKMFKRR